MFGESVRAQAPAEGVQKYQSSFRLRVKDTHGLYGLIAFRNVSCTARLHSSAADSHFTPNLTDTGHLAEGDPALSESKRRKQIPSHL